MILKSQVDDGFQQRVAGREKLGLRLTRDQRLLEGHASIAVEHRIAPPSRRN